jgi:hypothetical protein
MMLLSKRCSDFTNLWANPNNIGCHTFGDTERAFVGTQEIESEVLNVLAVDILKLNLTNLMVI